MRSKEYDYKRYIQIGVELKKKRKKKQRERYDYSYKYIYIKFYDVTIGQKKLISVNQSKEE